MLRADGLGTLRLSIGRTLVRSLSKTILLDSHRETSLTAVVDRIPHDSCATENRPDGHTRGSAHQVDQREVEPIPSRALPTPRSHCLDLRATEPEMVRRIVDFASGLKYALDGRMAKTAQGVILVTPAGSSLGVGEQERLARIGLFGNPS